MEPLVVVTGLFMFALAAGSALAPQSFSRNWVDGAEWQTDPEKAAKKQRDYAYVSASVLGLFGFLLVSIGLVV
ncbi:MULTISPECIES: hypothetical protein [unclassified Haladaptatus]|uniref:hypothetical protein n=1 Tax=unclassified Haladaptatus TaxID=2622732 RepID=UPI0023E85A8F|nr:MULTISPECIES: hypothetical protein [unclassified Haladaptatus]